MGRVVGGCCWLPCLPVCLSITHDLLTPRLEMPYAACSTLISNPSHHPCPHTTSHYPRYCLSPAVACRTTGSVSSRMSELPELPRDRWGRRRELPELAQPTFTNHTP